MKIFVIRIILLLLLVQLADSWSTSPGSAASSSNLQNQNGGQVTRWWERNNAKQNDLESGQLDIQKEQRENQQPAFFIRESMMVDMGKASKILADGFFKDSTNFITYQLERLETYLSLESGFPKPYSNHQIFVACEYSTGKVIGVAEVDARLDGVGVRGKNGPYMCNVAVDENFLRMGIATALVEQCESQVQDWVYDNQSSISNSLYLKVRERNKAAISMYDKLGYQSILQEEEKKTGQKVLVMRKQLPLHEKSPSSTAAKVSSFLQKHSL